MKAITTMKIYDVLFTIPSFCIFLSSFGTFLAQEVKSALSQLGGLAKEFAVETKGLEYVYHEPRAFVSMAVNYATANPTT